MLCSIVIPYVGARIFLAPNLAEDFRNVCWESYNLRGNFKIHWAQKPKIQYNIIAHCLN